VWRASKLIETQTKEIVKTEVVRKSEERLSKIFNATPDSVVISRLRDGLLMYINPAFTNMLEFTPEEALGKTSIDLNIWVRPEEWQTLIGELEEKGKVSGFETEFRTKENEVIYVAVSASLIDMEGEECIVSLTSDITERKKAEEEARQLRGELAYVERFSTMGEMGTTLAHELNQPLAAISNYAQGCINRLRTGIDDPTSLLSAMEKVYEQAGRAGDLISNVRSFVRKEQPQWTSINVNQIVREITDLLAADARLNQITIVLELNETLPWVKGNPIQIQQVILNLARNGMEAMKESDTASRRLTITTSEHADGMIEITVRDVGQGLPPGDKERLFTPFFTTKSYGLGLGLSISQSIIAAHGGEIGFIPDGGMGTVVRFTLPHNNGGSPDDD
jgi:two-component system sensor histidine kinase DctS